MFSSLYPYICKYGTFPTGHPEIITENFKSMDTKPYHGIVKCRVLVPAGLLHPVLPYRSKGKLLFPVCRTCAETRSEEHCEHRDEERAIEGAWPSCELYRAMDKGTLINQSINQSVNQSINQSINYRMSSDTGHRGVSLS
jgi:hypothetical protein